VYIRRAASNVICRRSLSLGIERCVDFKPFGATRGLRSSYWSRGAGASRQ
jgi:hypothetical protein